MYNLPKQLKGPRRARCIFEGKCRKTTQDQQFHPFILSIKFSPSSLSSLSVFYKKRKGAFVNAIG
jgi:hypothetical protein